MKQRRIVILVLICFLVCGCHDMPREKKQTEESENIKPEKLVVYMSAFPHTFIYHQTEEVKTLYPSKSTIGTVTIGGDISSVNGNIFEAALSQYSRESGIEIEIHYLEEYENDGTYNILQDLVDQNKPLPDLLILGKNSKLDYHNLVQQGYLLDVSEYFERNEEMKDDTKYYQEVLKGGVIDEGQFVIPILFNMNGIITTSSYISSIDRQNPTQGSSYMEILEILTRSCVVMEEDETISALYENSGRLPRGQYIPSILMAAAYSNYFDEEYKYNIIQAEAINGILELMSAYNDQEFTNIASQEELSYAEKINSNLAKSLQIVDSVDAYRQIGIFLSGGRSGGASLHNSLLTDLAFFQTIYEENQEEMVFCGIPLYEDSDSYAANVSLFAVGLQETKYPEYVWDVMKFLMDYEFPSSYGFSVNREITEKMIEDLQNANYSIYSEEVWAGINGGKELEDLQSSIIHLDPLHKENAEKMLYMLNNIDGAGLPCSVLEYNLFAYMIQKLNDGEKNIEDTTRWGLEKLDQYIREREKMEPFYNESFIYSIMVTGD